MIVRGYCPEMRHGRMATPGHKKTSEMLVSTWRLFIPRQKPAGTGPGFYR